MRFVIFGLTISSSWGNGHATLWRGLCRGLAARGHQVTFFERDAPYYAAHRDLARPDGCALRLYRSWQEAAPEAERLAAEADVAMVTSYCPDAAHATALVLASRAHLKVFYDLDTPVTLDALARGERVAYVPDEGLGAFDLVLSFTGGAALDVLRERLGARRVEPLYGSADPDAHRPAAETAPRFALSYLGTYAADRQAALDRLFVEPARRRPDRSFALAGSQYPASGFPWQPNIFYFAHLAPPAHAAFFADAAVTLNVTRRAMAAMGYCPSGRLFEAAACEAPIVSDRWAGIEQFFEPGREILLADDTDEVLAAVDMDPQQRRALGRRARRRVLADHTAEARALQLEQIITNVGHHSSRGAGQPHAAAGVLEGTAAGRQPA